MAKASAKDQQKAGVNFNCLGQVKRKGNHPTHSMNQLVDQRGIDKSTDVEAFDFLKGRLDKAAVH